VSRVQVLHVCSGIGVLLPKVSGATLEVMNGSCIVTDLTQCRIRMDRVEVLHDNAKAGWFSSLHVNTSSNRFPLLTSLVEMDRTRAQPLNY
jgi:hypothetical protein